MSDCIGRCAWGTTHDGFEEQHGVVVCARCERVVRCINHEGHGALLADGSVMDLVGWQRAQPLGTDEEVS